MNREEKNNMIVTLEEMLKDDGRAELICQFCKNIYIVNDTELLSLIDY